MPEYGPGQGQEHFSGAEGVKQRAREILDRVEQNAAGVNDTVSPARQEETGALLAPEASASGAAAIDHINAVAAQVQRDKRHAAEDAQLAAQREIDRPGAQAARDALREARAAGGRPTDRIPEQARDPDRQPSEAEQ